MYLTNYVVQCLNDHFTYLYFGTITGVLVSKFIKVQFEEFEYDMNEETYCFPWTFGYRFTITKADLENVEEVAMWRSCSLDTKNSAKGENVDPGLLADPYVVSSWEEKMLNTVNR
uniref:Uncharacterized protein n=1 Tax=Oncorhynchus kisutch TaxID=8019 RepID=A0A8C7FRE8_ONCKI